RAATRSCAGLIACGSRASGRAGRLALIEQSVRSCVCRCVRPALLCARRGSADAQREKCVPMCQELGRLVRCGSPPRFPATVFRILLVLLVGTVRSAKAQPGPGPATAGAGPDFVTSGLDAKGEVHLLINKSTIVTTSRPQKRLSVGEPSIVDLNGISPTR